MENRGLCFAFDDEQGDERNEESKRGGRGGRIWRGRPRGPRRGRGRGEEPENLRRFSSADNLNRSSRDTREHSGGFRGGRRAHARDLSCDSRGRGNDSRGRENDSRGGGNEGGGRGAGRFRGFPRGENQRGRGGYQGPNKGGRPRHFPLRHIAEMDDIDDITLRLNSQIDEFENLLSEDTMPSDDALMVLKILNRVVQNDLQREIVMKVLQVVCMSRFLDAHLTFLIQKLPSLLTSGSRDKVIEAIEFIHQLISQICLKMPSFGTKGFLLLTILINNHEIKTMLDQATPNLANTLKEVLEVCEERMKGVQESGQRDASRWRARRGPNEDDETPPEDFSSLPIFPSAVDMERTGRIFLRANKETGAFQDSDHYLDVHFRLMREDYIRPLRNGIREFKQLREKGETIKRSSDLRLYYNVHVLNMVCKESLEHRLQFDVTRQLKGVRWQSSKRLLFGSLICLSSDDFENCYFAVVTNREVKDLEKGLIQVRFESGVEEVLGASSSDTFTMAETTAYFEAYKHVLEGLREMKGSLPMSRYLVECNPSIKPPSYLLMNQAAVKMDLRALLRHGIHPDSSSVTVINPQRWPKLEDTTLNASQMQAVQTALTKELAIIQGPPGTGKTYVGLKVAEVLLQNRNAWSRQRPMLVVCYTNHALDQFLEGILAFCPEGIVRVGSRCKNPDLEEFNLKNIRRKSREERKVNLSVRNSTRDCVRNLKAQKELIEDVAAKLEATTNGIVSVSVLRPHMLPGQYESLVDTGRSGLGSSVGRVEMMDWLSDGIFLQSGGQEEEAKGGNLYAMLAAEVTSQILNGEDLCHENNVGLNDVHTLSARVRAQLYRFWLQKLLSSPHQSPTLQTEAKQGILPDVFLQQVISSHLYSAIIYPMMQQQQRQTRYFIRGWLGVSDSSSPELVYNIINGRETCHEAHFAPNQISSLPWKTRTELYRFWLQKTTRRVTGGQNFPPRFDNVQELAQREILPDDLLMRVVEPGLFAAVRKNMQERHERQSRYFIQAWLGIQEFCQNPGDLQRVLEQLEDDAEEVKNEEEEEDLLNVDEEADLIQSQRRLDVDDEEDLFDFGKKKSSFVKLAMKALGVQSTSTVLSTTSADDGSFSIPLYQKKQLARKLKKLLTSSRPMSQAEAESVINLWNPSLNVENRMRLYLFWLQNYQDDLRSSVQSKAEVYNTFSQLLRELRLGEDKAILMDAKVIGMTTTGAARYRRVLSGVACPIIILEEAAEVLEAHVVTTLHKDCQHLILIGDHQQLRPSPTVYELCRHYKLDLSLFERLVNNQMPHSTLAVQHRMRPDIAGLVRHVYPDLLDHETTLSRPHIRGVKQDVFLFHHEVEETRNDETSSKSNQHEAELCVRLCRYFLQQGYSRQAITILTAYSGQVFALKTIMKNDQQFFQGVRVTAVDNYQGEENDIIILSLVRSNQEGSVGFLGTDNRVCVAISRARDGFFAFGNFRLLAENSALWKNICRTAKEHGQLGDTLMLRCENHPQQEVEVSTAKDFDKTPEGGCRLPCGTRLVKCGHVCELSCHGYDRNHEQYTCRKHCERIVCKEGHGCTKKCFMECGQCLFRVEKVVPTCGHKAEMECSRQPFTWNCKDRCPGILPCGHQCSGQCGECRKKKRHDDKCTVEVDKVWPCGHLVTGPCNVTPGEWPCSKPCGATLDCGHQCQGSCGKCWMQRVHVQCKRKCGRELPGCGHKCRLPCGTDCLPCQEKSCGTSCGHSICRQPCRQPCLPCMEPCPWKKCRHQECNSLCHKPCQPCPKPCHRKLKCLLEGPEESAGHTCRGLCGEKCFCFTCEKSSFVPLVIAGALTEEQSQNVDEQTKLVKLPRCGHIFNVDVLDVYVKKKCESLSPGGMLTCPLPECNKEILERDCWRYHGLLRERHERFQKIKEELMIKTTISRERRQKLKDSLRMLTHDAEKEKSFASKAALGQIFKDDTDISINTAFALTNQIKLTRIFEQTVTALDQVSTAKAKMEKDLEFLKNLLFKPGTDMPAQRLRELRQAIQRFVDMSKLQMGMSLTESSDLRTVIQSSLDILQKATELHQWTAADKEKAFNTCQLTCHSRWSELTKAINDTAILLAPPEQDLCDVKIPRN